MSARRPLALWRPLTANAGCHKSDDKEEKEEARSDEGTLCDRRSERVAPRKPDQGPRCRYSESTTNETLGGCGHRWHSNMCTKGSGS